jgi:hypothetical protein
VNWFKIRSHAIRAIFTLSLVLFSLPSEALEVGQVNCQKANSEAHCTIQLLGTVEADDALFIRSIGDIDIATYGDIELGRTGYFFDKEIYARFIPRVYSLRPLAGRDSPLISISVKTLSYGNKFGILYVTPI